MNRRAVYPGSFDPPTNGHLDIINRAATMFDELIVAIGNNSEKDPFLPVEDRLAALQEATKDLPNVKITTFQGLLVNYVESQNTRIIIRGLRAVTDFDYEFRIGLANKSLAPDIETIFLIAREEYSFLASSVVREVARLGGDYKKFVPPPVAQLVDKRLASLTGPRSE